MIQLPKKILRIKELTYILPDDFDGTFDDAINFFLEYRDANKSDAKFIDPIEKFSTIEVLLLSRIKNDVKACGQYGIFELVDGSYKIVEGTSPEV